MFHSLNKVKHFYISCLVEIFVLRYIPPFSTLVVPFPLTSPPNPSTFFPLLPFHLHQNLNQWWAGISLVLSSPDRLSPQLELAGGWSSTTPAPHLSLLNEGMYFPGVAGERAAQAGGLKRPCGSGSLSKWASLYSLSSSSSCSLELPAFLSKYLTDFSHVLPINLNWLTTNLAANILRLSTSASQNVDARSHQ